MSICELEIGWVETENDRRYLRWELLACDDVLGVFHTIRADVLAVLFNGERSAFDTWARTLRTEEITACTAIRTRPGSELRGASG